ncbi:MAG TPA: sugar phosphate isomerase/epimerase family protein [Bryobacteraceae bacterium]|nr:sugar phosphate isomerase/epimerase family protein [Bryobacteraceae bacterium]
MPDLRDLEIGAMFWMVRDTVHKMKVLGFHCGQLGVAGDVSLDDDAAAQWKEELRKEDFELVTVFAAYVGESYADIPTVQQTVGFIPPATREVREARTIELSDFAAALGVKSIACHIGFVPDDDKHPDYLAVRGMVRRICDHAAKHGQTFALETGQEPANTLMHFLKDTGRDNLGINFDPANMILYGTGDPIEALGTLASKVISVHAKDGDWPPTDVPGALGTEKPLGLGSVNMERFMAKLKEIGYRGTVNIEREIEDIELRYADMAMGRDLLERLRG